MTAAVYWDASAILSLVAEDRFSDAARRHLKRPGPHLVSSLTFAEVCAVLARLRDERHVSRKDADRIARGLQARPWSALHLQPDRRLTADLSSRHLLRGADLWHLAVAATLAAELPGLSIATFDERLAGAARAEGLAPA